MHFATQGAGALCCPTGVAKNVLALEKILHMFSFAALLTNIDSHI